MTFPIIHDYYSLDTEKNMANINKKFSIQNNFIYLLHFQDYFLVVDILLYFQISSGNPELCTQWQQIWTLHLKMSKLHCVRKYKIKWHL